jgi:hypothetical protein
MSYGKSSAFEADRPATIREIVAGLFVRQEHSE